MEQFLEREIINHRCLNHPNILKFYDYFTDSKNIYLLLELCQSDLFQRLKLKETFNEQECAK
jgi:serine/threonine protein kinase